MGWLLHGMCTWTFRLFIAYQVLSCYWAFDYVDGIPFREDVKSNFQLAFHIWIWLSIAFGLSTFIGIRNFCQSDTEQFPQDENGEIYYDFLDVGSRYAFLLSWMYYFIVTITWVHHGQLKVPPYGGGNLIIFMGFIILLLLAYVNEINIKILQVILAVAHLFICLLIPNYWGIMVSIIMILNSPFILTCADPAPVVMNPTFIFTFLTFLSCVSMTNFFRTMKETGTVAIRLDTLFDMNTK